MSYYHQLLLMLALCVFWGFALLWGIAMLMHWVGLLHV